MSKEMVVLIDETKPVHFLGEKMPLPIEIIPFGKETTKKQIQALGLSGHFRMEHNTFFMTDNQNVILDTVLPQGMAIKELHGQIKALVGVVETGLFFDLAKKVLIGHTDGSVEIKLAP
jgi:ribose 5-phosphate isomerase A